MATVGEFVQSKLTRFGVNLSQTELDALLIDAGTSANAEYSSDTAPKAKGALLNGLSDLLAMPDVTEGGYSVKWNRDGVKAYLLSLRDDLGLTVVTTTAVPTVTDKSYLW